MAEAGNARTDAMSGAGQDAGGSAEASVADSASVADAGDRCSPDAARCEDGLRERCEETAWQPDPCPAESPICEGGRCSVRGPTPVPVDGFLVDSTEVTIGHYREFLLAVGEATGGQPSFCAWNTSFYEGMPSGPADWPVTQVDWCDAWAFCSWAGKRLCGAIEGGRLDSGKSLDPTAGQWILACGGPEAASHPNNDPDCNDAGSGPTPVGSHPGCEGFYPGLFDLEGNVAEWVDSCSGDSGRTDSCAVLGDSYIALKAHCTSRFQVARDTRAPTFGFRCCSD